MSPAVLADGTLAWIEKHPSEASRQLRSTNKKLPVRWKDRSLHSLRTAPGGQTWIAVEAKAENPSKVWLVGPDEGCEKLLFETKHSLTFADAAASPSRLLVTAKDGDVQRLALKELPGEDFLCPRPQPAGP
jgi:hypothetical protein